MTTRLYTHAAGLRHQGPPGHPERPDRLRALETAFADPAFDALERIDAPLGSDDDIVRCHPREFIDRVVAAEPETGLSGIDADTYLSPGSVEAARRAVGAAVDAVGAVLDGAVANAFCCMRPPGHHAERNTAMGFCLFNSIAIAARHAREARGLERVAIVDFDVHHGNGTEDIFQDDPSVFYASTHQMPLYPGTGERSMRGAGNIFNAPLNPGAGSGEFREAIRNVVLPALNSFAPDLVLISAGFDAHERDPLAQLRLTEDDFAWVTDELMAVADAHAGGRVVSVLEGGYDLTGLARSASVHVQSLMKA